MNKQIDEPGNQQKPEDDGVPKFGRLLIVLLLGVMVVAAITFLSEAYYRG